CVCALDALAGISERPAFPTRRSSDLDYAVARDGLERGAFCRMPDGEPYVGDVWPGPCYFPDFTDPAVRRWWGGLHRELLDAGVRSEEHTSELQSRENLVCRLLLEEKN